MRLLATMRRTIPHAGKLLESGRAAHFSRPLPRFQAALGQVEEQIVARNASRMFPYPFLQPSLIPTSTNI